MTEPIPIRINVPLHEDHLSFFAHIVPTEPNANKAFQGVIDAEIQRHGLHGNSEVSMYEITPFKLPGRNLCFVAAQLIDLAGSGYIKRQVTFEVDDPLEAEEAQPDQFLHLSGAPDQAGNTKRYPVLDGARPFLSMLRGIAIERAHQNN